MAQMIVEFIPDIAEADADIAGFMVGLVWVVGVEMKVFRKWMVFL